MRGFLFFLAVIIGAVILGVVDYWLGISYNDVTMCAHIAHKVAYMAWGSILVKIIL
jgi:hypothetical protein